MEEQLARGRSQRLVALQTTTDEVLSQKVSRITNVARGHTGVQFNYARTHSLQRVFERLERVLDRLFRDLLTSVAVARDLKRGHLSEKTRFKPELKPNSPFQQ